MYYMQKYNLNLEKPLLMGILNVTSDSFFDGGKYLDKKNLEQKIKEMMEYGADIIDIGAQSTFVDRKKISVEDEISRVLQAISLIKNNKKRNPLISIDTYRSQVAKVALQNGANMINDVTGLRADPQMAKVVAEFQCPIVLMYAKDADARTTEDLIEYDDIIDTLTKFFEKRIVYAVSQGVLRENIILDPGMGFFVSANPKYSFEILDRITELKNYFNLPILVGTSRKSFLSLDAKLSASERLEGSLVTAAIALYNGASVIRAHDIFATKKMMDTMTYFTCK